MLLSLYVEFSFRDFQIGGPVLWKDYIQDGVGNLIKIYL